MAPRDATAPHYMPPPHLGVPVTASLARFTRLQTVSVRHTQARLVYQPRSTTHLVMSVLGPSGRLGLAPGTGGRAATLA
jgi:hypothetical protein